MLHTSLALMFIYCRYKSTVTKLITLQMLHCTVRSYFSLYFVKYMLYQKMSEIKL